MGSLFTEQSIVARYSEITEFSIAVSERPIKQEFLLLHSAMIYHNTPKGKYRYCVCSTSVQQNKYLERL